MATIKFLIQSTNNPAGIYVRLKEGRLIDVKAKTKLIINPDDWSAPKGKPKHLKDESLKKLNADLDKFRNKLLSYYNDSHNKLEINAQWLKDFINPPVISVDITNKLTEYYDYYALYKKADLGYTTFMKLNVQKHLIEKFQKETKTEYLIKDVNANFKLKFETFCIKANYSPNTIAQVIKSIKTICYHAQTNGIEVSNQLSNITVKWQKADKVYLNLDELKLIEKVKLDSDNFLNARDWLLISCETGQRVSDFLRFTKENIRIEEGKHLIEFTQVKTGKLMTVPLSKRVLAILKKRKGNFPKPMSDQKYNSYIKDVCKLARLTQKVKGSIIDKETKRKKTGEFEKWELVSSHIGRRSFATNNYGRIPTSLLIDATGHSTEKMFLEYIGKSDTQKAKQLAEYF
ncbi:MAG: tyrosine-type recombinase/integrase [Bacteroidia bacterium]